MTKFDKDFKKFINDNYKRTILGSNHWAIDVNFYNMPIEMQFGVYQLFSDSVDIELRIRVNHLNGMYVGIINQGITEAKKTRQEVMCLLITDFKNQYNNQ